MIGMLAAFQLHKRGGKERDCIAVGTFLASRGHEVILVTTSDNLIGSIPFKIKTVPRSGLTNHARSFAFARSVADLAAYSNVDVLLAFEKIPGADFHFAADAALASQVSFFKSLLPRYRSMLALEHAVFGKSASTRVFFLTERQRDEYLAIYDFDPARATVLPLILHDERYEAVLNPSSRARVRKELGIPMGVPVAISIAVQPMKKGIDRTLEALVKHPQLRLIIAGSSERWLGARPDRVS